LEIYFECTRHWYFLCGSRMFWSRRSQWTF